MTHAALKDLLPCPFCGEAAIVREPGSDDGFAIHIHCRCGVTMLGKRNHFSTAAEAITAWNRRTALSAMEGEAVAFCDPSNPYNSEAFSWPGVGRNPAHTSPLYTAPPPQQAEPADTGHSCSYYCDRPECVKAQRDELREAHVTRQSEGMVCIGWEFNDPRDELGWQRLHGVGPASSPPYAGPVQVRRIFAAAPADAGEVASTSAKLDAAIATGNSLIAEREILYRKLGEAEAELAAVREDADWIAKMEAFIGPSALTYMRREFDAARGAG